MTPRDLFRKTLAFTVCLQFQVVMTEQEVGVGEDTAIYDITLTDIDNSSLGNTLQ